MTRKDRSKEEYWGGREGRWKREGSEERKKRCGRSSSRKCFTGKKQRRTRETRLALRSHASLSHIR